MGEVKHFQPFFNNMTVKHNVNLILLFKKR